MHQTTLCVPLEVKPESCGRLTALIDAFKVGQDGGTDPMYPNFHGIYTAVPTLHFMSISVFPGNHYDPLFILEANFDGLPGPFWGQIEALAGEELRQMIRCCKRPFDGSGNLYDAVTGNGGVAAVAYLEAHVQQPSVYHQGNRGLTRDRILGEHALFLAVRDEIDDPARIGPCPYRAAGATGMHERLRAKMLPHFAWLAEAAPPRITRSERVGDFLRLMRFLVLTLLVLSLPGLLLAAAFDTLLYLAILAVAAVLTFGLLWHNRHAIVGSEVVSRVKFQAFSLERAVLAAIGVALYAVLGVIVLSPLIFAIYGAGLLAHDANLGARPDFWFVVRETARAIALGGLSVLVTVPLLMLVLRYNEMRDSSQDAPPVDDAVLREIVRREDWIMQNHMGSIVLIKPGILRSVIIRAGHYGLGLILRATAQDGYLGSMRTVHFAHWAFLNNSSRLLFFSNFDHSWGSYLDDFIEKSHTGLTLAWGSGVGFPATRMLVLDGASHGRQFKNWALASRSVSRFWYSAYRDLTVDQIERNFRLATGLRQANMTDQEATAWAWDL